MADYNKLAGLVGAHEDLVIFKIFRKLNAENLVYLQADLGHLESELENIELEDKCSEDSEKSAYGNSLFDLRDPEGTSKDLQWRKVLEIREKLKAYSISCP